MTSIRQPKLIIHVITWVAVLLSFAPPAFSAAHIPLAGNAAFPPFADPRDNSQLQSWAKEYLGPEGDQWLYIDDRWAEYIQGWDHKDNMVLAFVRFEVTSATFANIIGARSMLRAAQVDCAGGRLRWLVTTAYAGNNFLGGEVHTTPDTQTWVPFGPAQSAEGALTAGICAAVATQTK